VTVELRPLTAADAEAHCAGEDDATVRWLSGAYGTVEGTVRYFDELARHALAGTGKRGFGVWLDGRLAGYVDYDPDVEPYSGQGFAVGPGDVNLAYAVHPWARGRGVAVDAVALVCHLLRAGSLGNRAVIRTEPANGASSRVAEKAGFRYLGDAVLEEAHLGRAVTFAVHVLEL
jgi:RimJ/RimL family protein N-acetyltransferase